MIQEGETLFAHFGGCISYAGLVISGLHMLHIHHQSCTQAQTNTNKIKREHTYFGPRPFLEAGPSEGLKVIRMPFNCFWKRIRFPIPLDLTLLCLPLGSKANEQGRHGKTGSHQQL